MADRPMIDVNEFLSKHLASASPDLLREMVTTFAETLMAAEADAVCGAAYGERSDERAPSQDDRNEDSVCLSASASITAPATIMSSR